MTHACLIQLSCGYETSWQYSVADSGRAMPGRRLGRHRTGAVRHHRWYSAGRAGVQDGGADVDPIRQDRGIWRRRGIDAAQYRVARTGRSVDGDWLRVRRTAELRHHHRHSVRHPVIQDGQAGAVAVWFADSLACNHRIQRSRPSDAVRYDVFILFLAGLDAARRVHRLACFDFCLRDANDTIVITIRITTMNKISMICL